MILVVGVSGRSGVVCGARLLEVLRKMKIETHLVASSAAVETLEIETGRRFENLESIASHAYRITDLSAPLASGSFRTEGMVIIPCSMKSLSGVANGYSDNLLLRAAEVTLKEKRPLILVPRETPLSTIHIRNMLLAAEAGATILPAMPGFYHRPKSIDDLVNHVVGKVLDVLRIGHNLYERWEGRRTTKGRTR